MKTYIVKKTGRTFGVFRNGELIEGGFFSKHSAQYACNEHNDRIAKMQKWQEVIDARKDRITA